MSSCSQAFLKTWPLTSDLETRRFSFRTRLRFFFVDTPMVSIWSSHTTLFLSYCAHKLGCLHGPPARQIVEAAAKFNFNFDLYSKLNWGAHFSIPQVNLCSTNSQHQPSQSSGIILSFSKIVLNHLVKTLLLNFFTSHHSILGSTFLPLLHFFPCIAF